MGDLANILSRLNSTPYITQEVIYGGGEPITPNQYVGNGVLFRICWYGAETDRRLQVMSRSTCLIFSAHRARLICHHRFRYTTMLRDSFLGGTISNLQSFDNLGTAVSLPLALQTY